MIYLTQKVVAAIDCMRRFRFEPRLLTRALLCIAAIGLPEVEELPVTESAVPLVAAAMDCYPDDRRLQGAGLSAAATASKNHATRVYKYLRRSILFASRKHADSKTVQKNACTVFERTGNLWKTPDGLIQTIELTQHFYQDSSVVTKACSAIKAMSKLFSDDLEGKLKPSHFERLVNLGEIMVDEEESLTNLCSTYAKMCSASYSTL